MVEVFVFRNDIRFSFLQKNPGERLGEHTPHDNTVLHHSGYGNNRISVYFYWSAIQEQLNAILDRQIILKIATHRGDMAREEDDQWICNCSDPKCFLHMKYRFAR